MWTCVTAASLSLASRTAALCARGSRIAMVRPRNWRRQYLVGCDGGSSAVRRQLGIKLQGEANLMQFRQALYRCDDLFDRIPIGKGRHYHVADAQVDIFDRSGFDAPLHVAFGRRQRRRYENDVRADRRHAGRIRDAVGRAMAAEFAGGGQLFQGAHFPRWRCGPPGDPDRRTRHEQRRRRRHRPVLETGGDTAGLGRAGPAGLLRNRTPPDWRPQCGSLAASFARTAGLARGLSAEYSRSNA